MKIKSQIEILIRNIELQEEAIEELCNIHKKNRKNLKPIEDIKIISKNLKKDKESLDNLQRQYEQKMFSKMVENGIENKGITRGVDREQLK